VTTGTLLLFFFPPQAARADDGIFGVWATEKNHGLVRIESCGSSVCAQVLDGDQLRANPEQMDIHNSDPAKRARRVKGLTILQGFHGGPTHWEGGSVYDPQTGDESSDGSIDLQNPDTLKVEGCRLLLCRSETWTRNARAF